jgi:hypothetical protein
MLALIVFALLFGFFIARAGDEHAEPLFNFWNAVFHVMMEITALVMRFAPLGVFGLVASVVAETGFDAVRPLGAVRADSNGCPRNTHALRHDAAADPPAGRRSPHGVSTGRCRLRC